MISAQWLWVCFFIHPHCCKAQCRMVIALTFGDVAKHLKLGGGVVKRNLPEIWTSILKINLKWNNYNRAFSDWFPLSYYSKFPKKREVLGSSPKKCLHFWSSMTAFVAFSKANSQNLNWLYLTKMVIISGTKNNNFIMQILPEHVKI
jgi:hypothetical protein